MNERDGLHAAGVGNASIRRYRYEYELARAPAAEGRNLAVAGDDREAELAGVAVYGAVRKLDVNVQTAIQPLAAHTGKSAASYDDGVLMLRTNHY